MRPIDADALISEIKKDTKKAIEQDDRVGSFWLGYAAGLVIKQPTIQPEPQWIPVSERLPSDGTWNIFTDGKNISVERYKADAIDHFFPNGRWFQLEDVIAWMPLPEPYKGGEKDG